MFISVLINYIKPKCNKPGNRIWAYGEDKLTTADKGYEITSLDETPISIYYLPHMPSAIDSSFPENVISLNDIVLTP